MATAILLGMVTTLFFEAGMADNVFFWIAWCAVIICNTSWYRRFEDGK